MWQNGDGIIWSIEHRSRGGKGRLHFRKRQKKICWPKCSVYMQRTNTEKTCGPLFWKRSDASAENADSPKAETKPFSKNSFFNRSITPRNLLLPSEEDGTHRQTWNCQSRDHSHLPWEQRSIRLPPDHSKIAQPHILFVTPAEWERAGRIRCISGFVRFSTSEIPSGNEPHQLVGSWVK